jgi:hypothetical protein
MPPPSSATTRGDDCTLVSSVFSVLESDTMMVPPSTSSPHSSSSTPSVMRSQELERRNERHLIKTNASNATAMTATDSPTETLSAGHGCENILCGYLYDGDLVFVILKGISIFKFPKRFLEISSRDLTSVLLQLIQRPDYQSTGVHSLCICMAQCLPSSSHTFSQFIRPMSLLVTQAN